MSAIVRIVGMDTLGVPARRGGRRVRTVVAIWAGRIKIGNDLRKELASIPITPGTAVEPFLSTPVLVAPQILVAAVEQH
jgi:hypothetical protein